MDTRSNRKKNILKKEWDHKPYFGRKGDLLGVGKAVERATGIATIGEYQGPTTITNKSKHTIYISFYLNRDKWVHHWVAENKRQFAPNTHIFTTLVNNPLTYLELATNKIIKLEPGQMVAVRMPCSLGYLSSWLPTIVCTMGEPSLLETQL